MKNPWKNALILALRTCVVFSYLFLIFVLANTVFGPHTITSGEVRLLLVIAVAAPAFWKMISAYEDLPDFERSRHRGIAT